MPWQLPWTHNPRQTLAHPQLLEGAIPPALLAVEAATRLMGADCFGSFILLFSFFGFGLFSAFDHHSVTKGFHRLLGR